ncbi:NUDIX hydrolase [Enterococcus ureasiticus]|uniref:8-oxo-dGTP diphosphatase n=1 Tax=Enterococcus ureasiticus TaxID=903984 RepID=A0A1E5GP36_9ENTE|nr:NUDIX domain-containing protein [Enterococcus ureasiticus]OEG14461.1 hypothetical protein BCR21_05580 [Enterococcus ureasiticus]
MLDIYDVNHMKTGKIIQRGEALLEDEFQLAACIVILNHNREFLVTQRHPKKQMGLYWEIPGGAVESNEKSEVAAIRELHEEIGIAVEVSELEFIGTTVYAPLHLLIDSYLIIKEVKLSRLVLQEEEVIATRFMHFNEIKKYRLEGKFTPFDYEVCKKLQQKITD